MNPGAFGALPPEIHDLEARLEQQQLEEEAPSPPNAEEIRIADEVFQEGSESHAVQGMLGLWGGQFLLHEMMIRSVGKKEEEDEEADEPNH